MPNTKTGGNRWVPDIRSENIDTYEESYNGQVEEYKLVNVHPIINGILDKTSFFRTHAAAVWYNKLAGKTLDTKIKEIDGKIQEINKKYPASTVKVYVSPTGSDETGDGTQENPWRQIKYAISKYTINNSTLYEIHAAGGSYKGFSVSNRRITLYMEGNITIVAETESSTCIGITTYGYLSISAASGTEYKLSLSSGKNGIELSQFSYCGVSANIQEMIFGTLNNACIYSSYNSILNCGAAYRVNSTCTCPNIFVSTMNGYINMRYSVLKGAINSAPTSAFYAYQGGRIYVRYANISSNCTNGLYALEGGQIYYSSTTNNAKTPMYASSGGRIYAGAQENTPSY